AFLTQCIDPRGIAANISYGRLRSVALSAMSYTTGHPVTFVQGSSETPTKVTGCPVVRSEEHTSELQSRFDIVCRLLLEKKKQCIPYDFFRFFRGISAVRRLQTSHTTTQLCFHCIH